MGIELSGANSQIKGKLAVLRRGYLSKSVAGSSDVALSTTEVENTFFELTGAIAANINVTCGSPASGQEIFVRNSTTGDFTLTWKGSSGTGIVLPRGRTVHLYSDGTNWLPAAVQTTRLAKSIGSDANVTLTADENGYDVMDFTSGVSLTATRNVVLQLMAGATKVVYNATTGAQSLQFIGPSGTGVTVANGKTCMIYCDGTNWRRITADNP